MLLSCVTGKRKEVCYKVEQCGTYRLAPELNNPVREVINEYHPHLSDAKIACMFRSGAWKQKGRTVLGRAVVAPTLWRILTGYDLILVINEVIYSSLTGKGKTALLDHELSRFTEPVENKQGEQNFSTQDHDIREFSEVVKRHNVCFSNLPAIDADGSRQLNMLETLAAAVEDPEQIHAFHKPVEREIEVVEPVELDEDDGYEYTVKRKFDFD